MRNWWFSIGLLFFIGIFFDAQAGEISDNDGSGLADYSGFYVGGQATTNGLGFNLKYIFNKRLTLKAGVESMRLSHSFLLEEDDMSYDAKVNYKTGGMFLLADFFYTRALYLSGGVMMNDFQPYMTGRAAESLEYGDINIPASKVGDFRITIEPELKYSPYGGLGIRTFMGKNKMVTWNFETGIYYMGPPNISIEATGLLSPTADPAHGQKEILEKQFSAYNLYPVVKLALSLRIF
ncbi:MAG: hypothetical protein PHS40_11550 [Mariniphaga sp.]|nr:hypothetical protein [Mariniphaga sp.]MDD4426551.1 hypothetical protein [Mariniphaga sp.]